MNIKGKASELWIPSAVPFFFFGFLYYLVTPVFSVNLSGSPLLEAALTYIGQESFDLRYGMDLIVIFVSWILGYYVGTSFTLVGRTGVKADTFRVSSAIIFIFFLAFLVFLLVRYLPVGHVFFSGYSQYEISFLGPLSTLLVLIAFFCNYFSSSSIKLLYFLMYLVASLVLLSFGSRMFFTISTVALIIGVFSRRKYLLSNPVVWVFSLLFLLIIIFVGVWRSGYEYSYMSFISIFLVEPLFTSVSSLLYIDNYGGRPIYSIPTDVFAGIVNFVPSVVYPGKFDVINSLSFDAHKESPFGASGLIVNLYSNFGAFYPIFLMFFGFYCGAMKASARYSPFFRAAYFILLPLVSLYFFREGFSTIFKVLFFNGLFMPLIIIFCISVLFSRPSLKASCNR